MFNSICQKSSEASECNVRQGSIEPAQPIHSVCNDFHNIDMKDVDTNYTISLLTPDNLCLEALNISITNTHTGHLELYQRLQCSVKVTICFLYVTEK